jgi:hypothetical protein
MRCVLSLGAAAHDRQALAGAVSDLEDSFGPGRLGALSALSVFL